MTTPPGTHGPLLNGVKSEHVGLPGVQGLQADSTLPTGGKPEKSLNAEAKQMGPAEPPDNSLNPDSKQMLQSLPRHEASSSRLQSLPQASQPVAPKLELFTPSPPHVNPSPPTDSNDEQSTPNPTRSSSLFPLKKKGGGKGKSKAEAIPPQLIGHLPVAEEEALSTFDELQGNWYYSSKIGRSKGQEDGMVCECSYSHGDDPGVACGEDSGCINRLTQVECLPRECRCREACQNQRFQKCQFSPVEIVQTEKKGFGLRAKKDIGAESFIYEYIGEIVPQQVFLKRMQQYKEEGIRHFYFMMLQREEYLDATKKGGKARFINHSCNPNCFVSKWHVGKHMRMGIFAKRDIGKDEELTFNYNVDRYGNDAQTCYCGEPNCVGSIGGKTQTDIGGMDQLFIDALGIADEVDRLEARGSRKKKSKVLDEDFNPVLRPIEEDEVAQVMTAIRQATSIRAILTKLLNRLQMTEDVQVHKRLVRLHGFVMMAGVFEEWPDDTEIITLALAGLARWPLIARNKVVDAGIESKVKHLTDHAESRISTLASQLLEAWGALEMSYRIAKREGLDEGRPSAMELWQERRRLDDEEAAAAAIPTPEGTADTSSSAEGLSNFSTLPPPSATLLKSAGSRGVSAFGGYAAAHRLGGHGSSGLTPRDFHSSDSPVTPRTPDGAVGAGIAQLLARTAKAGGGVGVIAPSITSAPTRTIEDIIRQATENEARQRRAAEEAATAALLRSREAEKKTGSNGDGSNGKRRAGDGTAGGSSSSRSEKRSKSHSNGSPSSSSAASLEKRLQKLVGDLVVRVMSKQKDSLDKEVFKKHAKDLTMLICAKEVKNGKSWPPKGGRLEELSSEKKMKMKAFATEYVNKLVARKGKVGAAGAGGLEQAASASNADTPATPASLSTPSTPLFPTTSRGIAASATSEGKVRGTSTLTSSEDREVDADGDGKDLMMELDDTQASLTAPSPTEGLN